MSVSLFKYNVDELQADPKVTAEEVRRAQVAQSTTNRIEHYINDLALLAGKDLRLQDTLAALITTGTKIMELGLHAKGRLKAAEGRSDAFLEATAANVKTAFRHAVALMDECDLDLGAWTEAMEIAKPAMDDLTRISKSLERPGVKTAVTPAVPEKPKPEPGPRLIEENGQPATAAEVPEPQEETTQVFQQVAGTLHCDGVPVVDAEVVDEPTQEELEETFSEMMKSLKEGADQVELPRAEWTKVRKAWEQVFQSSPVDAVRRLTFAVYYRTEESWGIPTDEEMQAFEEAQTQDTPENVQPLGRAAGEE